MINSLLYVAMKFFFLLTKIWLTLSHILSYNSITANPLDLEDLQLLNCNLIWLTLSHILSYNSITANLLGLEGQEYVSLLQWVEQTYPGPELMGSSALNIDKHLIPPLLAPEVVDALMSSYLDNMRENYSSWMRVNHI